MGAVYLAQDTDLNRPVALKLLPRDKANNPTLVKRFKSLLPSAPSGGSLRIERSCAPTCRGS